MKAEKRNFVKPAVIVLAVLLALSIAALAVTVIRNKSLEGTEATVAVPDNIITPDDEGNVGTADSTENVPAVSSDTESRNIALSLSLYNKQPRENMAFGVVDMLPGDVKTEYFRLNVSYHDTVTVHFGTDIHSGYEKLAEVLKLRVKLLTTGETLYDGLMRDIGDEAVHTLVSSDGTTDELYYEITAYLDTSVVNEYQSKALMADFKWWVEETGNLDEIPKTGDGFNITLFAATAIASTFLCIFLPLTGRKKENEHNE